MEPSKRPTHAHGINDNASAPTPAKRHRISLACHACRTRKSKCDGSRPKCAACTHLELECIYTPSNTSTNVIVQKDYLQSLESRMISLEESLHVVKNHMSELSYRVDGNIDVNNRLDAAPEPAQRAALATIADIEDPVDAMGTVVFADEEDCGYFGPSSNIAFLRHLSHAVSYNSSSPMVARDSPAIGKVSLDGGFINASRPSSSRPGGIDLTSANQQETDIFALPPPQETSRLVFQYFNDSGLLFPYIYPPSFLETYRSMTENSCKVRRTWLGLLNMMLAMANITAAPNGEPAKQRIAAADVFYKRALNLCGNEMLRGTTLEVVQYLLLMGQYMQGTQKSVQAWTVHGLAVKAALQLGLHSKDASAVFSPQEKEIRKRTWFACVVLDRTLSMTLGRPPAIPDSFVRLELPTNNINGDSDGPTPITIVDSKTFQMSLDFFNSTILLYKQLFVIVDLLYGQNLGCDPPLTVSQGVGHILSVEQQFVAWERSLPQNINIITVDRIREANGDMPDLPQFYSLKFSVILTLRYLHLRILLHRPILVKFIDACGKGGIDAHEESLLQQIGSNSMQICMECAISIIDIIHEVVHSSGWQKGLQGAWWFSLHYTFHSALIILGTIWVVRDGSPARASLSYDLDRLHIYPSQAVAALYKLDSGNHIVDRCRYYLEQFSDAVNPRGEAGLANIGIGSHPVGISGSNANTSPLGLEFGEFMMDKDLWTLINRSEFLPSE